MVLAGALSLAGCGSRGLPGFVSAPGIQDISVSASHQLVLMTDATVGSRGDNPHGELGNGTNSPTTQFDRVRGLSDVVAVAAGSLTVYSMISTLSSPFQGSLKNGNSTTTAFSLAIRKDGTVWAWGANDHGQLGDGSKNDRNIPAQVKNLADVTAISAGEGFALALRTDGTVWAWGANDDAQLGNGSKEDSSTPVQVKSLTNVRAISAGGSFGVALRSDGTVWQWGLNNMGDSTPNGKTTYWGVGPGKNRWNPVPIEVADISDVLAIAAGSFHCVALERNGTVWAWGATHDLFSGGEAPDSTVPVRFGEFSDATAIAAAGGASLALRRDGTMWGWGDNRSGQLGDGTHVYRESPVMAKNIEGVTKLFAGEFYTLARAKDQSIWGWGDNHHNPAGGDAPRESFTETPTRLDAMSNVVISAISR